MRVVWLAVLSFSSAWGQSFYGTLRGRVLDPTGSAASAVIVSLTDEGTSTGRKTVTNEQGEYSFPSLTPSRQPHKKIFRFQIQTRRSCLNAPHRRASGAPNSSESAAH